MKFILFVFLLVISFCVISCGTQQRIPNYLQHATDSSGKGNVQIPELRIQKNDLLSIQVYSASTRPEISDVIYNLPSLQAEGSSSSSGSTPSGGYLVDINGNIEYPRIGLLQAEGLTKLQLADAIKKKINEKDSVLTNPSVIIRFLNLKVTVLGEVNRQGPISVPGERVTILEAIGLAGGATDFGLKNSVKVMREIDGKREMGVVDLSSKDLFESPYYNLMQNDVVVVDPTNRKAKKAEQDVVMRQVSFGLSLITAIALLYNIFN
ncbi:MAG TPA: polysaccharide biosynthesis/export family protein [Chitinophagaceae bacterium]|nr:polysaccharide biosynthesis/export family protein [Chitinophagaceae bacterium]